MKIKGPQDINVKTYIFRSFTFKDILALILIFLALALMVVLPIKGKTIVITIFIPISMLLIIRFNNKRGYEYLIQVFDF